MKTADFLDKVQELRLDDNYDMNAGGCGCFALLILTYMPHLDVVFCTKQEEHVKRIKQNKPTSCSHVVLTDHENVYDSDGVHPMSEIGMYDNAIKVSKEYLQISIEEATNWNDEFDRKQLPVIEKLVANQFEQLNSKQDAGQQRKISKGVRKSIQPKAPIESRAGIF